MKISKAVHFAVLDGATRQIVLTLPAFSGPIVRIEPAEEGAAKVMTQGDTFIITVEQVRVVESKDD
jgi:hypothetical protein